jgi:hypothetical protein
MMSSTDVLTYSEICNRLVSLRTFLSCHSIDDAIVVASKVKLVEQVDELWLMTNAYPSNPCLCRMLSQALILLEEQEAMITKLASTIESNKQKTNRWQIVTKYLLNKFKL